MYKQTIIIFGIVIPGAALLIVLAVIWVMLGKFDAERVAKEDALEKAKASSLRERALAAKLEPGKGQMEYWDDVFRKDTIQSFNQSLDKIMGRFDGDQLSLAAAKRPSGSSNIAQETEAKASLFQLTFEGGYGPMQELLAELEARMPQLVLEAMTVSPGKHTGKGYQRRLKFEVTYMAWEK